jgi:hypothetical protein
MGAPDSAFFEWFGMPRASLVDCLRRSLTTSKT